ncbi:MAG: CoA transferase, partial [Acidimicrobiia bacterium]
AGTYCGKVFADLGADVVKVELPGGDPLRTNAPAFAHLNTNKRSVVVDGPGGAALLDDLLDAADVVVQSKGMGDLESFGFSTDEVLARLPSLVVTTISGFGATGPYATYRWSDLVVQLAASAATGAGVPVKLPGIVALCTVGHTAAMGGLAGVLRARASGAGAHIDCSALEALASVPLRVSRWLGWEYAGRAQVGPLTLTSGLTLIPIGLFPCADGYVALMSTPQQLPEMLDVLDDDTLREAFARPDAFLRPETKEALDLALYPWLLSRTREEATRDAQAIGWPLAGVLSPEEVLQVDHLHQRAFWARVDDAEVGRVRLAGPPYRHAEGGWQLRRGAPRLGEHQDDVRAQLASSPKRAPAGTGDPDTPPLEGIRVLDLTNVYSGPFLTQLLGDLGAEVIRVENPSVFPPTTKGYVPRPANDMVLGSLLSMYAPQVDGTEDRPYNRHAMNNAIARNKLSCTLDPRTPETHELFMQLVEHSDVLVENLKASALHAIGITESELLDRNPRLVVLRIPPAGLTGDWAHYKGFGAQFDGLSGLASMLGHAGSQLVDTPSTMHMDAATGPAGAFALLAALHYRDSTGRGGVLELAQMENVVHQLGDIYVQAQTGPPPVRLGNRDAEHAPQGIYRCEGGRRWLALTVTNDEQWAALARIVGRPELATDPHFADAAARRFHHDELDEILGAWAAEQGALDAFHTLQAAGIAASPDFDNQMLVDDPNVEARGWLRPLTATDVGEHQYFGHAFQGVPQVWRRGSPSLGEDNEYVFRTLLGVSDDDCARLEAARVITRDYLDENGEPV